MAAPKRRTSIQTLEHQAEALSKMILRAQKKAAKLAKQDGKEKEYNELLGKIAYAHQILLPVLQAMGQGSTENTPIALLAFELQAERKAAGKPLDAVGKRTELPQS